MSNADVVFLIFYGVVLVLLASMAFSMERGPRR